MNQFIPKNYILVPLKFISIRPRPSKLPAVIGAITNKAITVKTMSTLPDNQGPWPTACTDIMIGRSREGSLMRLYYPTTSQNTQLKEKDLASWYLGSKYTEGIAKFIFPAVPSLFAFFFNWQTKRAKISAAWEAPLAKGKFPLIIFSHGLSGHRSLYSTICSDLSSYGFIVAALEHRDESACGTFTLTKSGEQEWLSIKILEKNVKEHPLRSKQVKIRASECIRILDVMENLNRGDNVKNELSSSFDLKSLKNRLDVSQPIIAGHSFGGATSLLALSRDKRFKYGILLDPWMFPLKDNLKQLEKSVPQPILIILTETFQNGTNFDAYKSIDFPQNKFVTLKGSLHQNQSDTPFLFGYFSKFLGGALSNIDPILSKMLNNQLMLNFLHTVLGKELPYVEIDLDLAQKHLEIGLSLTPATKKETKDLLLQPEKKAE